MSSSATEEDPFRRFVRARTLLIYERAMHYPHTLPPLIVWDLPNIRISRQKR